MAKQKCRNCGKKATRKLTYRHFDRKMTSCWCQGCFPGVLDLARRDPPVG